MADLLTDRQLPALDTLPVEEVAQARGYASQRLEEYLPQLDTRAGVLDELLAALHAILQAALDQKVTRLEQSRNLVDINQDPTLADDASVDRLLSNYGITRRPGSAASGEIEIVLDRPLRPVLPRGTLFSVGTLRYATPLPISVRSSSAELIEAGDRLLVPVPAPAGATPSYRFRFPVTATTPGLATRLRRGDNLDMVDPLGGLLRVQVVSDFVGGSDPESNEELLARQKLGVTLQSFSNRATLEALVLQQSAFQEISALSLIGRGDAEQRRYHGLIPVAAQGALDLWVRSGELPQRTVVAVTAGRVGTLGGAGVYQFTLDRTLAPAALDILAIQDVDSGALYSLSNLEADLDLRPLPDPEGGLTRLPDLSTAHEGRFSPFQTLLGRFAVPGGVAAQIPVEVELWLPGSLSSLQSFLGSRAQLPPGADLVVRSAVPAFMSLSLVVYPSAGKTVDGVGLQKALAAFVNRTGFLARISAADLASVAQGFLGPGYLLGRLDLAATVLYPDGFRQRLHSSEFLEAPTQPTRMVSPRTVVFYLDPRAIGLVIRARG